MFLVNMEWRGGDFVGCEGRSRTGRLIGHDEGKVGTAAGLDTGLGCSESKATRNEKRTEIAHNSTHSM